MPAPRDRKRCAAVLAVIALTLTACSAPTPSGPADESAVRMTAWGPCPETESQGHGIECASVTVPFDYADPAGASFTVPLARIPSKAANPKLLMMNPGGPGISGVNDLRSDPEYYAQFADAYEVVSFDPRGVGASQPAVRCLDERQRAAIFDQPSVPQTPAEMQRANELAKGIGAACQQRFGPALPHVTTTNVVRDMDAIRQAMGFDKISFLGFSYGTFVGALYAQMFPANTDRMVLDSVMDPKLTYPEVRRGQADGMQRSVTAFVDDCLGRSDCPLAGPTERGLQTIYDLIGQLNGQPHIGADGRQLSGARMLALIESSQYSPGEGWPSLRKTLTHAIAGDWTAVVDAAYSPDLMVNPADSEYLSVVCIDFQVDRDVNAPMRLAPEWARQSPISGGARAWSLAPCEQWPVPVQRTPAPVHPEGAGPILILNMTGDPATPLSWAQSLHDQIEGSALVIAPGEGHIASSHNACAEQRLMDFLLKGTPPPATVYTCPGDK